MMIVVTTVHVLACIILVLSVLLQAGKGADMGAVFGGASTTIFGSSGAGNFLTRITTGAAICFMVTSLALTYSPQRGGVSSVMPESAPVPGAAQQVPMDAPLGDAGAPETGAAVPGDGAAVNGEAAPVEQAAGDAPVAAPAPAPNAPAPAANAPAPAPNAAPPAGDAAAPPAGADAPAAAQ
jgi:preprotein translocase subunit SecG